MIKAGIDTDALVKMFSEASAKQGEALRKAVSDATGGTFGAPVGSTKSVMLCGGTVAESEPPL